MKEVCSRCCRWAEVRKGICQWCVREMQAVAELLAREAMPDPRAQPHRCTSFRCVDCTLDDDRPRFLVRRMTLHEQRLKAGGQSCSLVEVD